MRKFFAVLAGLALVPGVALAADAIAGFEKPYVVGSTLDDNGEFSTNSKGLSYGSELDVADPSEAPDLVAAWATNGQHGYVLRSELERAIQDPTHRGTVLAVYDQNMIEKVGEFEIPPAELVSDPDAVIVKGASEDG